MQAIETKYLGPTNFRGARIKATAQAGSITIPWDHELNVEGNHDAAARALVRKWGWFGSWIRGALPSGRGNVYVALNGYVSTDGHVKTPHPQAVNPLNYIIVRPEGS